MHEMGIVLNIVREATQQAKVFQVSKIGSLTLQIGELTGVESHYVRACWPAATENTVLEGAELIIEHLDGIVTCKVCSHEYNLLENMANHAAVCPECQCRDWELKQGREVLIKEIGVCDE